MVRADLVAKDLETYGIPKLHLVEPGLDQRRAMTPHPLLRSTGVCVPTVKGHEEAGVSVTAHRSPRAKDTISVPVITFV